MWVNFVVVCEPSQQLVEDGTGVGFGADPGIIALQCPGERLGHAVFLGDIDFVAAIVSAGTGDVIGGSIIAVVLLLSIGLDTL